MMLALPELNHPPDWDRNGITFDDIDGYGVVIQNMHWGERGDYFAAELLCLKWQNYPVIMILTSAFRCELNRSKRTLPDAHIRFVQ